MASATTTLATLREHLAKETGYYFSGTASGTHSTTTLEDDSADGFDGYDDNLLTGKWLHIVTDTGGAAPEGEARKVSSVSTTTLTVDTAFSAAPADNDTYELLPHHPRVFNRAIQEAVRSAYPTLFVPLKNESIVIDNILSNSDGAAFSGGAFTSWSSKGSPSISQQTENGATFFRITASGATEGLEQDVFSSLNQFPDVEGKTFRAQAWVRCSTASAARIRVTFDGSTFTNGPWHSGSGLWESPSTHVLTANIPSGATEATVSMEVTDGNTGDFDLVTAWMGHINLYTIPSDFVTGPARVSQQQFMNKPNGPYIPIARHNRARSGHILRLEGKGRLTVPSADDDTVEVDETKADYIVALAAEALFRNLKNSSPSDDSDYWEERRAYWASQAEERMLRPGVRMRMAADAMRGGWSITEDASGRYLELLR